MQSSYLPTLGENIVHDWSNRTSSSRKPRRVVSQQKPNLTPSCQSSMFLRTPYVGQGWKKRQTESADSTQRSTTGSRPSACGPSASSFSISSQVGSGLGKRANSNSSLHQSL